MRPGGYAVITGPDQVVEFDTFSCGHCGAVRHVRPKQRPEDIGGLCRQCMTAICPHCVESGRCDPLEKKLARAEARDLALRSYGG